jgi:caffeoyl-CoA O-methyltransferase
VPDDNDDRIDAYIRELFIPDDDALRGATSAMQAAGLPTIQVPPPLGRLLGILVRAVGARRVLELGTLGGYSAIWMARALPADGRLISLEVNPHHAEVARANLARAGVAGRVEVRVGKALDLLPAVTVEAPFDLAFIDADKVSYPAYLEWAVRLVRPGGLLVADNALRGGAVIDPSPDDEDARAIHEFNRRAAAHPRLDAIILPNRGGRDGILIAAVRAGGS